MRKMKISLCYHPTTITLIDDNKDFINHLVINFNEVIPCLSFVSPLSALEYFKNSYSHSSFAANCIKNYESVEAQELASAIDIQKIQQEIFSKERFSKIAVALIDYNMPALNGIELSKSLKELGILTILLTGEAENELAISALNQGYIDYFVKKTEDNSTDILLEIIKKMEKRYFLKLSSELLSKMPSYILGCLSDPEVAEIFDIICEENKIIEFYICNEMGSFLLADKTGKTTYFVLASEEDMERYYEYANDEEAPSIVIDALKNRTKIPLFYSEQTLNAKPSEWEQYMRPAKKIRGNLNYYYAFTDDCGSNSLSSKNILSYKDYLKKH